MAKPEQLPSGRWRVRFTEDDGRRRTSTFDSETEAAHFLIRREAGLTDGSYVPPASSTAFDDWAQEYLKRAKHTVRPTTWAQNEHYYRHHIKPQWGRRPVAKIRRSEILQWIAELKATGTTVRGKKMAPGTIEKTYSIFRTMYRAATDEGIVRVDELPKRPRVVGDKQKPIRFLTEREIERLATAMEDRFEALVWVGCYCGLRLGELAALRLDDVDLERETLRVDEGIVEVNGHILVQEVKTRKSVRVVPIPMRAKAALEAHLAKYKASADPTDFVFTAGRGSIIRKNNFRRREWETAVKAAHLEPLTPHDMRHTAASNFIAVGASKWQVADALGHADTRMVDLVYGHLFSSDRDDLKRRVNARTKATFAAAREELAGVVEDLEVTA